MTTGFIGADSATVDGIAIDLSVPSTVQSGDVLVLIATAAVSGTFTTPSGWTQDGGNAAVMLAYKTATASDPGATVQIVYSGNGLFCAGLVAYRPASGGLVSINYGTGLLASGVSTTAANQTAVAFWVACGNNGNGIAPPTSMDGSIRYDAATPTNACVVADLLQTTAGACPAEQATGGSATGYENVWAYFVVQVAAAPQAATLAYPPNASYLDASTVDLQAIFNSSDGANANADCVRIKAAGASSYSYVNTSTNALQSTPVWNPCTVSPDYPVAVSLPSGAVSDGNIYNWSIAFQEALANLQGPFASDFTFTAQAPPGLTVSEPAGSETTGAIALTYTATPQSGTSIIGGRWLIYPTATSSAPGFTINIGVGTIPAGAVSDVTWTGNPLTVPAQSGVALTAGGFTAFAAVQETGSVWSSTIPSAFTVAFDPPAQPSLTATASTDPSTGAPIVAVTVQGHDNMVSAADASFEGSLGTMTAGANTSIALSSAEALDGTESLAISATAAGNTLTYGTTYSIVGGASYVWVGAARAAASSRTFEEYVNFKDGSGAYISNLAATASDDTTGWTYAVGVCPAPSNAATAYLANVVETATGPIGAPTSPAVTTAATGGSIPASTARFYKVTAVNVYGESTPSAEVTVTTGTGATNANTVTWTPPPLPAGSTGNLVYDSEFVHATDPVAPTWGGVVANPGGTFSVANNTLYFAGNGSPSAYAYPSSQLVSFVAGTQYTMSCYLGVPAGTTGSLQTSLWFPALNGGFASCPPVAAGSALTQSVTFTAPSALQIATRDVSGLADYFPLSDAPGSTTAAGWAGSTVTGSVSFSGGGSPDNYPDDKSTFFNGGYISGPLWLNQTVGFSYSTWVYVGGSGSGCLMFNGTATAGVGLGLGLGDYYTDGTNVIVIYQGSRWIDSGHSLTNGWHHIGLIVDSSGYPWVYVDGVQVYTDTGAAPVAGSLGSESYLGTDPASFTARTLTAGVYYQAQVGVYNTDIGAGEIAKIYASATGVPQMRMLGFDTGKLTVPSGQVVQVYAPQIYEGAYVAGQDAIGPLWDFNVYASTASGGEELQASAGTALHYVDTAASLASGVTPPTVDGTGEKHYLDCCGIFPGDTLGYQLEVLSDGPSVYFPLTDGPGSLTAANAVGSGNGTVTGGVTFGQPGVIASDPSQTAALFDGSTGYIQSANSYTMDLLTGAVSFEFWVKIGVYPPSGSSYNLISGEEYADIGVVMSASQGLDSWCGGQAFNAQPAVSLGVWHHVVCVYEGNGSSSRTLYLDGAVYATDTSGAAANFSGVVTIGGGVYVYDIDLNGAMTQVAVYPTALTAARVLAHYQAALNTSGSIVQKWTRGGLAGTTTATVTRTGQNAGTVATVPLPAPSQAAAITDNAVEFGADITYTAVVQATV